MEHIDGRARVIIRNIKPEIDHGSYPAKRTAGETMAVEADIFADGHDSLSAVLLNRKNDDSTWREAPMEFLSNDRWQGKFILSETGYYVYTVTAWIDRFKTWQEDIRKRVAAGQQDIDVYLAMGANLVIEASHQAEGADVKKILGWGWSLESAAISTQEKIDLALNVELSQLMQKYSLKKFAVIYPRHLSVLVDRERSRFSSWYEMFPRSCSSQPGKHGTFKDCEARLPYIAEMGFNVLYLPPIHPVGRTNRKGKNNSLVAGPDDPGTPWAIGSTEGGFKAINPQLGTLDDFQHLVKKSRAHGLEIALDIGFQCSPDHPYVNEHPEWFIRRPDGTIRYAENPPKKYQDIYPLNFESDDWEALWEELRSVIYFWIEKDVHIFRMDNPHTKPFKFWEWLIRTVKEKYPDTIFLAEAFTRPKVMYQLARLGFTQSYTYFAWRNTKREITQYLTELTQTSIKDYFRPHFWPNTPDILTEYLQLGGKPAFMSRLVLAATLSSNYGIYGPAFELMENTPKEPGSEEYLNSEKYEIRRWDIERPDSLKGFISRINAIRRDNPALQYNDNLWFNATNNDELLCFSKHMDDLSSIIFVVVNLDPRNKQSGWVNVPMNSWGLDATKPYQMHDLLSNARYLWTGEWNYVELDPHSSPAHVFRINRLIRTEHDFDYYM